MQEHSRKTEMNEFMSIFEGMPDRLSKYMEIVTFKEKASPVCYQDTMSYRRLAIAVTTYCNISCKWCYRFDPKFAKILNKHMDIEVFKKIIRNSEGRFRLIHLAGTGEPLMYPHLYEAITIAREKTDQVKITTNGTIIGPKEVDALVKAGLTHIEFSIDAFTLQELTDFRGSNLDKIVEVLKYISANTDLVLQINSVVNKINYDSLFKVVETLKEVKNIDNLHTIPLFNTAQMREEGIDHTVSDEDYRKLLRQIEDDIEKEGLSWKVNPPSKGVGVDPIIEIKRQHKTCFTCFEDPYIDTEGNLTICGRREFHPVSDATEGFEKAMNAPKILQFRENMLNHRYDKFCETLCYLPPRDENKA